MNLAQNLGSLLRQDSPHRSARQEQRERQVRHSEGQPVRQRQRPEHARRDLRLRRAQSAALRVGFEDRPSCTWPTSARALSEEVTTVTKGANLGWRVWEGSFRFVNGPEVSMETPRSDPKVTYPVVEFAQLDPLLQNSSAVTMGYVYRHNRLEGADEPAVVRRQPVRRDVLRQRRQTAAQRRPGRDSPHRVQRQGSDEDAAGSGEGEGRSRRARNRRLAPTFVTARGRTAGSSSSTSGMG